VADKVAHKQYTKQNLASSDGPHITRFSQAGPKKTLEKPCKPNKKGNGI
jgi:hypothetical protein